MERRSVLRSVATAVVAPVLQPPTSSSTSIDLDTGERLVYDDNSIIVTIEDRDGESSTVKFYDSDGERVSWLAAGVKQIDINDDEVVVSTETPDWCDSDHCRHFDIERGGWTYEELEVVA